MYLKLSLYHCCKIGKVLYFFLFGGFVFSPYCRKVPCTKYSQPRTSTNLLVFIHPISSIPGKFGNIVIKI